jgi:hypothetical protein
MSDDNDAAALRARLEAIIKEAEDVEAQAATACRRIQAACLLAEEFNAIALEQTATIFPGHDAAARLHRLFDLRRHGRHRTSPSGGRSAQHLLAGEHHPRLLHQLRLLA